MRGGRVIRWLGLVGALVAGLTVGATAQGSISAQVLQLLTRDNTWSGVNTYANTVGLALQSGVVPPATQTNRLYNLGGQLWWNGALITTTATTGTVTSVGLALPAEFTVTNSPVVTTGTLTGTWASQSANLVFASPDGAPGTPAFRALTADDLPAIPSGDITGIVAVANGGTGLASGTSGGVLAYTGSGTIASSGVLSANQILLGGGAGAVPTSLGSLGTTTTVLHGNAAGAPTFAAVSLTTDVTGQLPFANGGTGLGVGISGGILGFTGTTTLASSALLTDSVLMVGGGAGATPSSLADGLGTTTTVLHGNAAGEPTFGAVDLAADVTGTLTVPNGGSGATTLTGILQGNGASAFTALTASTVGQVLRVTGANTFAWGAVDLADTDAVTGVLAEANGGTGVNLGSATNGQLLIGNGSGVTLAALTGTANQVVVTNGAGSIQLATPQSIGTASTPQFARLGLGAGAGATAVLTTTGQFNVGYFSDGSCGAADTINWNSGMVHTSTLSAAACTYTFANPISGVLYTLSVVQDGTGGRLVTWPGTVQWAGGSAPTLSTTPGATDVCRFLYDGAFYQGQCSAPTSPSTILSQTIVLTQAEILALPTTPITIVPAPGASSRLVFVGADLETSLAAAYTNVDTAALLTVSWSTDVASTAISNEGAFTELDSFLTDAASTAYLIPATQTGASEAIAVVYGSAHLNEALVVTADNAAAGDFTGGDAANTVTVTVYYYIR